MVKSETYFNRLILIDSLISLNGIIISLTEFQLKLINLIEQFSKELISEGHCEQLIDDLCQIICRYFDENITLHLKADNISWKKNLLLHHFYGYSIESAPLIEKMESLLQKCEGEIYGYTSRLLALMLNSLGENEKISLLLAQHTPKIVTEENSEPENQKKEENIICISRDLI